MKWKAVFFDFDGVILDSVEIKTQAFATMFRQYGPDVEQAVVDYHLANGGISRFTKFEYYYKHLLQKPINQKILKSLGREFNRIVLNSVLNASFIDGALNTLEDLTEKKIPAFVVSGTPDEEIKMIVEERKLSPFFLEVHGSPCKKSDIVSDICIRHRLHPQNCLFIGDAMTDYDAAKSIGTAFLGIVKQGETSPFPEGTMESKRVKI